MLETAAVSKYFSLWREPRQIKFAETDKGPRIVAKSSLKRRSDRKPTGI